jgi:hypothetical protein
MLKDVIFLFCYSNYLSTVLKLSLVGCWNTREIFLVSILKILE